MFVSASLLVTFIINTAALMRALHWVRELAACTDAGSTCLFDVQVWLYNLILSDFVRVDPITLELWARGLCEEVASSSVALLEARLPANLLTTDVRPCPLPAACVHCMCCYQHFQVQACLINAAFPFEYRWLLAADACRADVQVAERCTQTSALHTLQLAPEHPEWLSNSKVRLQR